MVLFVQNCFEKCTYFFADIKDDLRNLPKQLRKTVITDANAKKDGVMIIKPRQLEHKDEIKHLPWLSDFNNIKHCGQFWKRIEKQIPSSNISAATGFFFR